MNYHLISCWFDKKLGGYFSETNWYTYVIICKKRFPTLKKWSRKITYLLTCFFWNFCPMWTFCYTIGKVGPWCHWMLAWVTLTAAATITATTTAAATAASAGWWPIRSTCSSCCSARRRWRPAWPLDWRSKSVMRLSEAINTALVNSLGTHHTRSLSSYSPAPASTHLYSSRWVAS